MSGIYVHIPFCQKKCAYCDFYSVEDIFQVDYFVDGLLQEIRLFRSKSNFVEDVRFDTIYFGGGTPSLLNVLQVDKILSAIYENFRISDELEITIEANPGTVDKEKLRSLKRSGINRISFGIQSFFDDDLEFLGRIHTSADSVKCIESAFDAGFENISVDLIFGLPEQDKKKWIKNLYTVIDLGIPHVSTYNLIIEKGTPLYEAVKVGKVKPLPEDEQANLYEITMEILENAGYIHYEVSNYAHAGFECKHNLKYWEYENYIGFGPSSHSFWINKRWWNVSNLHKYLMAIKSGKIPIANFEILSVDKMIEEFIYLGLRSKGVDLRKFKEKFAFDFVDGEIMESLSELKNLGYIKIDGYQVKLSRKGFLVCDEIALNLISKTKYALK